MTAILVPFLGLCGGAKTITGGDRVNGKDGWSARIMWRKDGRGEAYVYHMDQPGKYGESFPFPEDYRFVPGIPVTLRLRVEMNTPAKRSGILRVWADDRPLVERLDLEWRATDAIGVNGLLFNTFHGGGDASWAPARDSHARFGNFAWSTD